MKPGLLPLLALFTFGCGSSDDNRNFESECGSFTGAYRVTERRESGTCPVSGDPYTVNVVANPDQTADVSFEEFGLVCDGTVNGCAIRGNCVVSSAPNTIEGNVTLNLTIHPGGLQGSYDVTLNPGSVVPEGCSGRFALSGTRR